ncbi:hypothetical protein [Malikia sp.]|uniref:hypothetical protein n=1 Tax=Malikia sp. TaxID=2070706 RepID=UPI002614570A|nr:hypothetical protein [Malikia sp.]MDD2728160.1 hypothetical protein [Malikia sp.]
MSNATMRRHQRQKFTDGFRAALFDSDLISTRLALATAEMCWAIMLLWPGDTFERPTYTVMSHVAPELVWAIAFLVTSVVQFSIVVYGAYRERWAHWFAGWNACIWGYTVVAMLLSVYPPPAAIGGELALMISAIWIWVRPIIMRHGERLHHA